MAIKKGWKITWITLGSLLGLVVLTVVIALWLVFTPSKLTKIVNNLAGNFITCDAKFGNVDLTLLSTFPDAGLKIEDVVIVNPTEGAVSDTLARIGSLTVGIDVKAFLKENKVIVHQVILDDAEADLFIAHDRKSNFDIFPPSEGDKDTSSSMPELIDIEKIKISNLNGSLIDDRDGIAAGFSDLNLSLKGRMDGKDVDGKLTLDVKDLICNLKDSTGDVIFSQLNGVKLKAKGSMKDDDIDADISIDAEHISYSTPPMNANLSGLSFDLDGKGSLVQIIGDLKLKVENGTFKNGDSEMVNEKLQMSKEDLLLVELPHFTYNIDKNELLLDNSRIKLDDYALNLLGQINLANDREPLRIDVKVNTDGDWQVKPLLDFIPEQYAGFTQGMDVDGKVTFDLTAAGTLSDSTMPAVSGTLQLDKGSFYAPQMLPYQLNKVKGTLTTDFYMDKSKESWVKIEGLKAHTRGTDVAIDGRIDDLMGDMRVDAKVKGTLPLEDIKPMLPSGIKVDVKGNADLDLKANFRMSQLQKKAFDKMKATGRLMLKNMDVLYDTIHATAPTLGIAIQMPAKSHKKMMAEAKIESGKIKMESGRRLQAEIENPNVSVGINNIMKDQLAASFDIAVGDCEATKDSMIVSLGELKLKGTMRLDSMQHNILKKFNPRFEATAYSALLYMPQMPEAVRLSEFDIDYRPNNCEIKRTQVRLGHSDFELYGTLENLEEWMSDKAMLRGNLHFTSSYADIDQMLDMFSGLGSNPDSLEAMRQEDNVPADANPFIVPKNVDVTLNTHIRRSVAFGNDLSDVAGSLTVKDGVAILDQMGFVCKAATMQLTALYRSPRPNNLFTSIDFHLLDIQIKELINMIPCIDTLVPMLSAFDGNANFHLAGETYLNARYEPKLQTIEGAAAISGQNLVVMDNNDIATIAKLMKFKKWKDKDDKITIDSLSVEMNCIDVGFGPEVEVLPFLLNVGSYQVCVSGVQNFDKSCSYHLELLKNPLLAKVAVDVKGSLTSPKIKLGRVIYADLFRPKRQGVAEKKALEIKNRIRKNLEARVR